MTASDGWFSNIKKHHNLVFRKICGECASIDEGICDDWKVKLQGFLLFSKLSKNMLAIFFKKIENNFTLSLAFLPLIYSLKIIRYTGGTLNIIHFIFDGISKNTTVQMCLAILIL